MIGYVTSTPTHLFSRFDTYIDKVWYQELLIWAFDSPLYFENSIENSKNHSKGVKNKRVREEKEAFHLKKKNAEAKKNHQWKQHKQWKFLHSEKLNGFPVNL